jgi:fructan beta-fructosidase
MNIRKMLFLPLLIVCTFNDLSAGELVIKIHKRYLNMPISQQLEPKRMTFNIDGKQIAGFNVRLTMNKPEYWVFYDLADYKGKILKIIYEGNAEALNKIYQSDNYQGEDTIYKEKNRPQFHFSAQRGWINDPNGLVYYEGEYHLFYQFNPYDKDWGNLNWGHAVSTDLLYWKQLPMALQADELGEIYSGSAVIDYDNTSGFGKNGKPAMVAIYTVQCHDGQIQCIAYSLNKGRTWKKYEKNPIINTRMNRGTWHNRDPKVFWYKPGKHWVMALHEKDGHSIYTSNNLKDWTYESHTAGFWECPELFELPVDGNKNKQKWVMSGASGTYMVGSLDGKKFIPETGKHYYATGYLYAPQTFNNIPENDGRRIQIGWASIKHEDMPFTGMMLLPVELTLRTTKDGIRLVSMPIKETEKLLEPVSLNKSLSMEQANDKLSSLKSLDRLCIKTTIKLTHPTNAGIEFFGQKILDYDMNFNKVNGTFYSPQDITSMELSAEIYIDKTSIEVFIDGGLYSYIIERKGEKNNGLRFWGLQDIEVKNLEIYSMKSIW